MNGIPKELRRLAISAVALGLLVLFLLLLPFERYAVRGREVSREEFLTQAGPFVLALSVLMLLIAGGVWREQRWTRPLMMGSLLTLMVYGAWRDELTIPRAALVLLVAAWQIWFWYFKPEVAEYYRRLSAGRAVSSPHE